MNKGGFKKIFAVTILALAFNALMPFFAVYDIPAAGAEQQKLADSLPSVFGDKILICTGDGFKLISRSDLEHGKEPLNHNSHFKCPLCYIAANGMTHMLLPQTTLVVKAPAISELAYILHYQQTVQGTIFSGIPLGRSPPASLIS